MSDQLRDSVGFRYEIGLLKRYKRTGWSQVGVPLPGGEQYVTRGHEPDAGVPVDGENEP